MCTGLPKAVSIWIFLFHMQFFFILYRMRNIHRSSMSSDGYVLLRCFISFLFMFMSIILTSIRICAHCYVTF